MSETSNLTQVLPDERIILNVGGIKYETFRSTLTAYPETLLGTMFHEHNKSLIQSNDDREFFFDRNGNAFHYIMEFYRNGEILWNPYNLRGVDGKLPVTRQELELELDYFQIQVKGKSNLVKDIRIKEALNSASNLINKFIKTLEELILAHLTNFGQTIIITTSPGTISVCTGYGEATIEASCLKGFENIGYRLFKESIFDVAQHLETIFSDLNIIIKYTETSEDGRAVVISFINDFKLAVENSIISRKRLRIN
ncbi:BTB/POZ protein [Glomus cerebriforme]|uniref:BTB/POZ protein n=1 Tax=Glomus cerebriforme TaxID=658196 RepID=A0A397T172_9GLOM|nr:BTB/POZ protein [Glomus cerebriforme]